MDFGDILEQWEKDRTKKTDKSADSQTFEDIINRWSDKQHIIEKATDLPQRGKKNPSRKTLRRMAPQETLDLHGYTVEDGLSELERFLLVSKRRGLKKVLIIHGKGNHSDTGDSILRREVRRYVAESPLCGEHGIPQPVLGGEGAVWILLR